MVSIASLIVYSTLGTLYIGDGFAPPVTDLPSAFYFAIVVMSTVGFGDIVPHTTDARFFTLTVIILGITMWIQQKLNPAPADPAQKMIFAWMPWVFMLMLGGFASGLVLYWIANNTITIIQQYSIMTMHGHRPDLFGNIRGSTGSKSGKTAKDKK